MLRLASLALLLALAPAAHAQLSGTYGIDGSRPTSGRSYQTFAEATAALMSQGVSGPVTFLVAYGSYPEQVTLGAIPGAGRVNTVTFDGTPDTGGRLPVIRHAATSASSNWVVRVDGARYVTFAELQVIPQGTAYARGFVFGQQSLAVTVRDCAFRSSSYTGSASSTEGALIYGNSSDVGADHTVTGSTLTSSVGRGIYFRGTSSSRAQRLTLSDNVITGTTRYGIDVRYLTEAEIRGNTVDTEGGIAAVYSDGLTLEGNQLRASGAHALYLFDIDAQGADRSLVANNFLSSTGAFSTVHVTSSTSDLDVVHNTVYQSVLAEEALEVASASASSLVVLNNILYAQGEAPAFKVVDAASIERADYNILRVSSGVFASVGGVGYASFTAYRGATGFGESSLRRTITFADAPGGDLHLVGASNGDDYLWATPLPAVRTDIDGGARSTLYPYRGADEASTPIVEPQAPGMQGTYTIDAAQPTGGLNYQTFADATLDLTSRGAQGDVTFEVTYGIYAEQVTLSDFTGSGSRTVRFLGLQDFGANYGEVPLVRTGPPASSRNWVIRIDAPNVILENLDVQATSQPPSGATGVLVRSNQSTLRDLTVSDVARGVVYDPLTPGAGAHLLAKSTIEEVSARGIWAEDLGAATLDVRQTTVHSTDAPDPDFVGVEVDDTGGAVTFDQSGARASDGVAMRLHDLRGGALLRNAVLEVFGGSALEATLTPALVVQATTVHVNAIEGPGVVIGPSATPAQLDNVILGHRGPGPFLQAGAQAVGHAEHIVYNTLLRSEPFAVEWDGATVLSLDALRAVSGTHAAADTLEVIHATAPSRPWPYLISPSNGDGFLIGAPLAGVTEDLYGTARSPTYPYVGAEEGSTPLTPPPPRLAGTYTIDPNGSGARNFTTLAEAFDTLEESGVLAPVTFQVFALPDPGSQNQLLKYPNMSPERPVRFEVAPGQSADLHDVLLLNAEFVTFDGIDFSVGLEILGRADIGGQVSEITVRNGAARSIQATVPEGVVGTVREVQIENMTDLRDGIYMSDVENVTLSGNTVTVLDDAPFAGIWIAGVDSAQVVGNVVTVRGAEAKTHGVVLSLRRNPDGSFVRSSCTHVDLLDNTVVQAEATSGTFGFMWGINTSCNDARLEGNRVRVRGATSIGMTVRTGIDEVAPQFFRKVQIYNNMVTAEGRPALRIDMGSAAGAYRVVNNTLVNEGVEETFDGGFWAGSLINRSLYVQNNVVANAGSGLAARLVGWTTITDPITLWSDGNVFTAAGPELIRVEKSPTVNAVYATVEAFNDDYLANPGNFGGPSDSFAVSFVDQPAGDLHLAPSMHGDARLGAPRFEAFGGTPAAPGALTDIDGDPRPGLTYRGADEVAGAPLAQPSTALAVTVLLQGPYDAATGQMRTDLRDAGALPLAQPYAAAAFDGTALDYDGAETTTADVLAENAVVDWVLVEVRRETYQAPFVRLAALLLADGSVVTADGAGPPDLGEFGTYNVVVRHRNHIAGMSVASENGAVSLASAVFNGHLGGAVELDDGRWALVAGDANADGSVLADDRQSVWLPAVGASGYEAADLDLDGSVLAGDRQVSLDPNVGRASQVPGAASLTGGETEGRAVEAERRAPAGQRPARRGE